MNLHSRHRTTPHLTTRHLTTLHLTTPHLTTLHLTSLSLILAAAVTGCLTDSTARHGYATPASDLKNVQNYAETAKGLPPEVVYGWGLRIDGDNAKWNECTSKDECRKVERTRPKKDLLGVEKLVGQQVDVDGESVEVLKLSLEPRPTYIVPSYKYPR